MSSHTTNYNNAKFNPDKAGFDFDRWKLVFIMTADGATAWHPKFEDEQFKADKLAEDKEALTAWKRFRSALAQVLPDTLLEMVAKYQTPNDVFAYLRDRYAKRTSITKLEVFDSLCTMRLNSSDSVAVEDFSKEIDRILILAERCKMVIPDDQVKLFILRAIDQGIDSFRIAVMSHPQIESWTVVELKNHMKFLASNTVITNNTGSALATSTTGKRVNKATTKGSANKSDEKDAKCSHCDKRGHIERECRKAAYDRGFQAGLNAAKSGKTVALTASAKQQTDRSKFFAELRGDAALMVAPMLSDLDANPSIANAVANSATPSTISNRFVVDSGASNHMCGNRQYFQSLTPITPRDITSASGHLLTATHIGSVHFSTEAGGRRILNNVLYVPGLRTDLLSINQITDSGCKITMKNGFFQIFARDGTPFGCSVRHASLSVLDLVPIPNLSALLTGPQSVTDSIWHRRLGHLGPRNLQLLANNDAIDLDDNPDTIACSTCCLSKQPAKPLPHPKKVISTAQPLERLHVDLWGPAPIASLGHSRYMITITDDFSRYTVVRFLKLKSDAANSLINYIQWAENQLNRKVKQVLSDGGGEFCNGSLKSFFNKHGIEHLVTVPHTPQQNGVAERINRTLLDKAKPMMLDSNVPPQLWPEAIDTAAYVQARSPHAKLKTKTPFELFFGKLPSYSEIRVFGCLAIATNANRRPKYTKLDPVAEKLVFVGYPVGSKGWKLYDPVTRKISIHRNVSFDETQFPLFAPDSSPDSDDFGFSLPDLPDLTTVAPVAPPVLPPAPELVVPLNQPVAPGRSTRSRHTIVEIPPYADQSIPASIHLKPELIRLVNDFVVTYPKPTPAQIDSHAAEYNETARRLEAVDYGIARLNATGETRGIISYAPAPAPAPAPSTDLTPEIDDSFTDAQDLSFDSLFALANTLTETASSDPRTYDEAISGPEGAHWLKAIESELQSLSDKNVFEPATCPPNVTPIRCKWVFRKKLHPDGSLDKYKARLVACGYTQKQGIDYSDTFAPVVNSATIKLIFALAAYFNLSSRHADIKTAFINAKLLEKLFMIPPRGWRSPRLPRCVWRLLRSLYGLKQAGRNWYLTLIDTLLSLGLVRSVHDDCLFIGHTSNALILVAVYVDDLLFVSSDSQALSDLLAKLGNVFDLSDLNEPTNFLGIEVRRTENSYHLSQRAYVNRMIEALQMSTVRGRSIPIGKLLPTLNDNSPSLSSSTEYRQIIGSLMYAMTGTRLDISYAVGYLARYFENPNESLLTAARNVAAYLKSSADVGIQFTRQESPRLIGYCDATFNDDPQTSRSTGAYVFTYGGSAICWKSKLQSLVAGGGTAESEMDALYTATKEAIWLNGLLSEIGYPQPQPIPIFCDNQAAVIIANGGGTHSKTKHFRYRIAFIRDYIAKKVISVHHIASADNPADVLTKALDKGLHGKHCRFLKVVAPTAL
jgi:hypothetical protein